MTSGSANALSNVKANKYSPSATGEQHRNEGISLTAKEKKGELNMAEQENPQYRFGMGLLIGGALGALAGIIFAPKSGKELRSDIKDKGNDVLKGAKKIYASAGTKTKEIIKEAKYQAKELKKEAEGAGEKIAGQVQEKIGQVKKVFGT